MKRSKGENIFSVFNYLFMFLFAVTVLYPFIHITSVSLSHPDVLNLQKLMFWPERLSISAYQTILDDRMFFMGYYNTMIRVGIGGVLTMFVMVCGSYALSKKRLPHRKFYTSFFVFTIFFSGGLIPEYMLIRDLSLINNRLYYMIPAIINVFHMLILRNFFMSVPEELEESAKLDGARELRILISIILPVSLPVIATVWLWTTVDLWNEWFRSMIYMNDLDKHVVQVYLRRVVRQASDPDLRRLIKEMDSGVMPPTESFKAAAVLLTMLPLLMVYPFIQKYFVKGVMVGAIKG